MSKEEEEEEEKQDDDDDEKVITKMKVIHELCASLSCLLNINIKLLT